MEADYDSHEVVRILEGFRLIDGESYARRYRRRFPVALAQGYYVVHWPPGLSRRRFDEHAQFVGPWHSRRQALTALAQMRLRHPSVPAPVPARLTEAVPRTAVATSHVKIGPPEDREPVAA